MNSGSSPLARGTLDTPEVENIHIGLIPARAGNTLIQPLIGGFGGAHPRSRGEHTRQSRRQTITTGSSPLARGTRCRRGRNRRLHGLIPARAGNTLCNHCTLGVTGAHPRSRGEHCLRMGGRGFRAGSSPLARGTLRRDQLDSLRHGLIPARAGNTTCCARSGGGLRAHPRSRGEHLKPGYGEICAWGSSPLARGTRVP